MGVKFLLPEIFGESEPHWSEMANFRSIFAHTASAVTPNEKKFNKN